MLSKYKPIDDTMEIGELHVFECEWILSSDTLQGLTRQWFPHEGSPEKYMENSDLLFNM